MGVFHVFQIAHMVLNRAMHYILRIVNNQMTNSSWKFYFMTEAATGGVL